MGCQSFVCLLTYIIQCNNYFFKSCCTYFTFHGGGGFVKKTMGILEVRGGLSIFQGMKRGNEQSEVDGTWMEAFTEGGFVGNSGVDSEPGGSAEEEAWEAAEVSVEESEESDICGAASDVGEPDVSERGLGGGGRDVSESACAGEEDTGGDLARGDGDVGGFDPVEGLMGKRSGACRWECNGVPTESLRDSVGGKGKGRRCWLWRG